MSKHHLKRGLQVFGAGIVITVATLIFMPNSRVLFGVLTLLGSSMLLLIPLDKMFKKLEHKGAGFAVGGAVVSFVLFLLAYPVNDGYLGIGKEVFVWLPSEWYANLFTSYLGFPAPGFWSTDYFSILPWFFLYAVGYFCYSIVLTSDSADATRNALSKSICPALGWIGRNALIIYMLHQPVVYGVLILWNMMR